MKKIIYPMAMAILMLCFTACTNDSIDNPMPQPEPEKELAEYTIMYYTSGAGDIDASMFGLLRNFNNANPEVYEKVNVVIQFKYSTAENLSQTIGASDPELSSTGRLRNAPPRSIC